MKQNRKIAAGICLTVLLTTLLCVGASADVIEGLQGAKDNLLDGIKIVLDTVIVPILITVDVVVLFFNLLGFLRSRNDGNDHSKQIIAMAITVAVGILLGSWYSWGAVMLGIGTTTPAAIRLYL